MGIPPTLLARHILTLESSENIFNITPFFMIPEFWTPLALEILALAGGLLALSLKIENVKLLKKFV